MERRAHPVALVLGAGGAAGHAYHAGVLCALAEVGWDARDADLIVGTSAGAQVAALLRVGIGPRALYARLLADPRALTGATGNRVGLPRLRWPASAAYLRAALRDPRRARLPSLLAALLPESDHLNAPLSATYARLLGDRWPARALFIVAVDLDTGARVVFGRDGAPTTGLCNAVACSSAVPALVRPGRAGGARFVDGAMASPTNTDVLVEAGLRPGLVLVLSPLSAFAPLRLLLRRELGLAGQRAHTVAVEPGREVTRAIGFRPLDAVQAPRVAEAAYRETLERLASPDDPLRAVLRGPPPPASRVTAPTTDATSR